MLYDLLSNMSNNNNSVCSNENSTESPNKESEATLLVNIATHKNISPANIRKLLLVPKKKKPSNKS